MSIELPPYEVIDIETTIRNRGEDSVGKMQGSPFHPENEMVLIGNLVDTGNEYFFDGVDTSEMYFWDRTECLVGQNIKFDLLWLMRTDKAKWTKWLQRNKIWDTMLVEYLITAQQNKMWSLDRLAQKYGGSVKDEKIKEYWKAGIDTNEIPEYELKEYLRNDLKNTELVFKRQYEEAIKLDMLPLIHTQMKALCATTEMEFNGMHFDIEKAAKISEEVIEEYSKIKSSLEMAMKVVGIKSPNPDSPVHISLHLFGGELKIKEPVVQTDRDGNVIKYKTGKRAGQPITKLTDMLYKIPGLGLTPDPKMESKRNGIYKTSEEVLKMYKHVEFVKALLEYRKLAKDISTYWQGVVKQYWPNDQCIHGSLNHAVTNTGRLSSSNPNMQNLSGKGK